MVTFVVLAASFLLGCPSANGVPELHLWTFFCAVGDLGLSNTRNNGGYPSESWLKFETKKQTHSLLWSLSVGPGVAYLASYHQIKSCTTKNDTTEIKQAQPSGRPGSMGHHSNKLTIFFSSVRPLLFNLEALNIDLSQSQYCLPHCVQDPNTTISTSASGFSSSYFS